MQVLKWKGVLCDLPSFCIPTRAHFYTKTLPTCDSGALQVSEAVAALKEVLDTLWQWVDETPPAAHTLRYGNPAFRWGTS